MNFRFRRFMDTGPVRYIRRHENAGFHRFRRFMNFRFRRFMDPGSVRYVRWHENAGFRRFRRFMNFRFRRFMDPGPVRYVRWHENAGFRRFMNFRFRRPVCSSIYQIVPVGIIYPAYLRDHILPEHQIGKIQDLFPAPEIPVKADQPAALIPAAAI